MSHTERGETNKDELPKEERDLADKGKLDAGCQATRSREAHEVSNGEAILQFEVLSQLECVGCLQMRRR